MKKELVNIIIPEGQFEVPVISFDESDKKLLYEIYLEWRSLCKKLKNIHSRKINLPEGLSESSFCLAMNCVRFISRINGANTSYDAYNLKTNKRIQVKGCSVLPDLTSFGPKSVWDEIYFVDFYREGSWDGTIDIYLIPNDLIYNHKVNGHETLRDQQEQKRRPRFSIYEELIIPHNIKPIKTFNLKPS